MGLILSKNTCETESRASVGRHLSRTQISAYFKKWLRKPAKIYTSCQLALCKKTAGLRTVLPNRAVTGPQFLAEFKVIFQWVAEILLNSAF